MIVDDVLTCPVCGTPNRAPDDATNGYCGRCHDFTWPVKFVDIHGHPMTLTGWAKLCEAIAVRILADTTIDSYRLRAIWTGVCDGLCAMPFGLALYPPDGRRHLTVLEEFNSRAEVDLAFTAVALWMGAHPGTLPTAAVVHDLMEAR